MENNTYIVERAKKILKICENASKDTFIKQHIDKSIEILSTYSFSSEINKKEILLAIKISKKILSLNDKLVEEGYTLNISPEEIDIYTDVQKLKIIKYNIENSNSDIIKIEDVEDISSIEEINDVENIEDFIEKQHAPIINYIEDKNIISIEIEDIMFIKIFDTIKTAFIYGVENKKITFNYIIEVLEITSIYTERETRYIERLNTFYSLSKEIIFLPKEIKILELEKKDILQDLALTNITQDKRRKLLSIESNLKSLHKHNLFLIEEINEFINIKKLMKIKRKNLKIDKIIKYILFSSLVLNAYMVYLINNYIFILTNQY